MGKHHGAWGDSYFSSRKGCDIFLEEDAEALGKKLSFLSSGSVSQKHPAREPWAHSPCPPGTRPPRPRLALQPWGVLHAQQFLKLLPPAPVNGLVSGDNSAYDNAPTHGSWKPTGDTGLHPK